MSYSELLKNPNWQRKRLEILNRDNFTCQLCGDTQSELHVHHLYYTKGRDPWEYPSDDLKTYCKDCHRLVEHLKGLEYDILSLTKMQYGKSAYFTALIKDKNFTTPSIVLLRDNPDLDKVEVFIRFDEAILKSMLSLLEMGSKITVNV